MTRRPAPHAMTPLRAALRRPSVAACAVLLALAGCGGGGAGRDDTAAGASAAAPAPAATGTAAAPPSPLPAAVEGDSASCPSDGRWRQCSVAQRLRNAGLVPHRRPGVERLPFLSVPGAVYDVHQVEVRAFVYDDLRTAEREALALDPIRVAPRGESIAWPMRATLAHSGNLIAIILATNERQIERVQLALEAGPPQPDPGPVKLPAAQGR